MGMVALVLWSLLVQEELLPLFCVADCPFGCCFRFLYPFLCTCFWGPHGFFVLIGVFLGVVRPTVVSGFFVLVFLVFNPATSPLHLATRRKCCACAFLTSFSFATSSLFLLFFLVSAMSSTKETRSEKRRQTQEAVTGDVSELTDSSR